MGSLLDIVKSVYIFLVADYTKAVQLCKKYEYASTASTDVDDDVNRKTRKEKCRRILDSDDDEDVTQTRKPAKLTKQFSISSLSKQLPTVPQALQSSSFSMSNRSK